MAAVTVATDLAPPTLASPRLGLSWGAIFGGMFVALGVWIMLLTLGLAIGLSAFNPSDLVSTRHAALGTGIASVIALFLSLLAGGLVAARSAGYIDRRVGALHGVVLWGFTTLVGSLFLGIALRAGVGAAMNMGSAAMGDATSSLPGVTREGDTLTQQPGHEVEGTVAPAVEATGKAMWWTFITQVVGLAASVAGASIGVSRTQRRVVTGGPSPVITTTRREALTHP